MENKNFEDWIDLDGVETERTYYFSCGFKYTIKNPTRLFIKKTGSHKLVDKEGTNHYIGSDWKTFSFKGEYRFNVE